MLGRCSQRPALFPRSRLARPGARRKVLSLLALPSPGPPPPPYGNAVLMDVKNIRPQDLEIPAGFPHSHKAISLF